MRPLYIFDIDGTLADNKHRAHFLKREKGTSPDWDKWYSLAHLDSPRTAVVKVLEHLLFTGVEIWFFTGRLEEYRKLTSDWLIKHTNVVHDEVHNGQLVMRATGDYRPDYVVKQEMVDRMLIEDRRRLVAVFDDRSQVVEMWRRNGINCFQVAPGDF